MKKTLIINVVQSNGTIDLAAMEADFNAKVKALKADRSLDETEIAAAVDAVFDRVEPGTRINLPVLSAMVLAELKVFNGHAKLDAQVQDYVRSNCQGKKVEGNWERPDSLFEMGKGSTNGGVCRRANREESETNKEAA